MFEKLGRKLDELIAALIERSRKTICYKLYAYIALRFMIKHGKFTDRKHFERTMRLVEKQVWRWRTDKLWKLYEIYEKQKKVTA